MEYKWIDFYKELAQKLLFYKNNRQELVKKVFQIYDITSIPLPTLEKDKALVDIDPFTFYGLFNKRITWENRIKICTVIRDLFGIIAEVPSDFNGLPVLNVQNAIFYSFINERKDDDIDSLWSLFESALKYSTDPNEVNVENVKKWFDVVINMKGNKSGKVTMGIFWIDPNAFINLDSRNRWYIYESGRIPSDIVKTLPNIDGMLTGEQYFTLLEILRKYLQSGRTELRDFIDLSYDAWEYSEQINKENGGKGFDAKQEEESRGVHYWVYAPGEQASQWDVFYNSRIMAINFEGGDLRNYSSKKAISEKLANINGNNEKYTNIARTDWQFVNDIKIGDVVFVKNGLHKIIGRGIVDGDYEFDAGQEAFQHVRRVNWTHSGEWDYPGQAALKTLTDITKNTDLVEKLSALFVDENGEIIEEPEVKYDYYDRNDFLDEVFLKNEEVYDTLVGLLEYKKNLILQGAPGVGKTHIAKRLAYSMMGVKDDRRIAIIQFHQSYSYEDFIMGFRPSIDNNAENEYELKYGIFYDFCKKAEEDDENDYFFIIDEINRGNISKIFGELFMLIEKDKRGEQAQLLYQNEKFSIPKNLYIIGTMNTADRSLAMIDYALRRRFAFYDIEPIFGTEAFNDYIDSKENEKLKKLVSAVESINENEILKDESLGKGFRIGHSYFMFGDREVSDEDLNNIVKYELIPLIEEYWFDEREKVKRISGILKDSIK